MNSFSPFINKKQQNKNIYTINGRLYQNLLQDYIYEKRFFFFIFVDQNKEKMCFFIILSKDLRVFTFNY